MHYRGRLRAIADDLDDEPGQDEQGVSSHILAERIKGQREAFDRFTLRIAGGTPEGYETLMRSNMTAYLMIAEEYLGKILYQQRQAKKAKAKHSR